MASHPAEAVQDVADIMLDSDGVNALRLRFPDASPPDLALGPGVHAVGRETHGRVGPVPVEQAILQFCVDRRGAWLQVREGARGVHVNGRPVRRMAMVRAGDSIFFEGADLQLLGDAPQPAPEEEFTGEAEVRIVLRGIGGQHHGRCFGLESALLVGRARSCNIRLEAAGVAEHHARLEPHPHGVVLRDMGSANGSIVNGHPTRHALLCSGDQLVFDAGQRFLVESPRAISSAALRNTAELESQPPLREAPSSDGNAWLRGSMRRFPWLLLAALLLSAALSLLLLYGAR